MAKQKPEPQPADDALIPRRIAFTKYLGCSISTGLRLERDLPDFPQAVIIGGTERSLRFGYRLSELQTYIATRPRKTEPNVRPLQHTAAVRAYHSGRKGTGKKVAA